MPARDLPQRSGRRRQGETGIQSKALLVGKRNNNDGLDGVGAATAEKIIAELKKAFPAPATPSPLPKNPTIHPGQQGKHIPGHNNFQAGKSELTHPNPQKLLDDFTGKGTLRGSAESGWKETVDFGEVIGNWVDPATGAKLPTTRGTISYNSKGQAHIVPSNPNPLK